MGAVTDTRSVPNPEDLTMGCHCSTVRPLQHALDRSIATPGLLPGRWRRAIRLAQEGRREHLSADRPGVPLLAQGFDALRKSPARVVNSTAVALGAVNP